MTPRPETSSGRDRWSASSPRMSYMRASTGGKNGHELASLGGRHNIEKHAGMETYEVLELERENRFPVDGWSLGDDGLVVVVRAEIAFAAEEAGVVDPYFAGGRDTGRGLLLAPEDLKRLRLRGTTQEGV